MMNKLLDIINNYRCFIKYKFGDEFTDDDIIKLEEELRYINPFIINKKKYYQIFDGKLLYDTAEHIECLESENHELKLQCNDWKKENQELKMIINELHEDNDIKFWKQKYMKQHNSTQLLLHELNNVIKEGYEVSDKFKEYVIDLEKTKKECEDKLNRLYSNE